MGRCDDCLAVREDLMDSRCSGCRAKYLGKLYEDHIASPQWLQAATDYQSLRTLALESGDPVALVTFAGLAAKEGDRVDDVEAAAKLLEAFDPPVKSAALYAEFVRVRRRRQHVLELFAEAGRQRGTEVDGGLDTRDGRVEVDEGPRTRPD